MTCIYSKCIFVSYCKYRIEIKLHTHTIQLQGLSSHRPSHSIQSSSPARIPFPFPSQPHRSCVAGDPLYPCFMDCPRAGSRVPSPRLHDPDCSLPLSRPNSFSRHACRYQRRPSLWKRQRCSRSRASARAMATGHGGMRRA